jgi:hypothetical protein
VTLKRTWKKPRKPLLCIWYTTISGLSRVVKAEDHNGFYPRLDSLRSLALTFVQKLHCHHSQTVYTPTEGSSPSSFCRPGPLATNEPCICQSPIFDQVVENRGPFASYRELTSSFNDRLRMAYEGEPLPNIGTFHDSAPLVLTSGS